MRRSHRALPPPFFDWHAPLRATIRFKQTQLRRSEEHTSELQSPYDLVCRVLLEKKKAAIVDIGDASGSIFPIVRIPILAFKGLIPILATVVLRPAGVVLIFGGTDGRRRHVSSDV